ncbi:MAG: hypothetical protein H6740_21460 [Alphaproteobacteria bacterium]|nr:hypothetical protein [Alphaproteobacteria bacterium]
MAFLDQLQGLGEVAIFGGMLRDLYLMGNRDFSSDIDLVLRGADETEFQRLMHLRGAKENAFGGFRLRVGEWQADVWQLDKTWAFRQKYCDNHGFRSLIRTTFFTWDALVFELGTEQLHALPRTFADIHAGLLEINLPENPNSMGALLRTLRFLAKRDVHLGPRLVTWLVMAFERVPVQAILEEDRRRSFVASTEERGFLSQQWLEGAKWAVRQHERQGSRTPLAMRSLPARQLSLLHSDHEASTVDKPQLELSFFGGDW